MRARLRLNARLALAWALALVLGGQAAALAWRLLVGARHHGPLLVIALMELAGGLLLLLSSRRSLGAVLLGAALLGGAVLHLLAHEAPPAAFVVYLAALWVVAEGERHG